MYTHTYIYIYIYIYRARAGWRAGCDVAVRQRDARAPRAKAPPNKSCAALSDVQKFWSQDLRTENKMKPSES